MREAVALAADVLLAASVTGVAGGGVDFAILADQLSSAASLTSSTHSSSNHIYKTYLRFIYKARLKLKCYW